MISRPRRRNPPPPPLGWETQHRIVRPRAPATPLCGREIFGCSAVPPAVRKDVVAEYAITVHACGPDHPYRTPLPRRPLPPGSQL